MENQNLKNVHIPECCLNFTIPLAFDESMSYLEMLCAMKDNLNKNNIQTNVNTNNIINLSENYEQNIKDALQELIDDGTISDLIQVNEIERIICVGDSYLNGVQTEGNGWGYELNKIMKLNNENFYTFAENGAGFTATGSSDHTFKQLLEVNAYKVENPETITKIICCGGINDAKTPDANFLTGIKNFKNYASSVFPNAKVYVGMISGDKRLNASSQTKREYIYGKILNAYNNSPSCGCINMPEVKYPMCYPDCFSDDLMHPNTLGNQHIANAIYNSIYGQYQMSWSHSAKIYPELSNNYFNFSIQVIGDNAHVYLSANSIKFTEPITTDNHGSIVLLPENSLASGSVNIALNMSILVKVQGENVYRPYPCIIYLNKNGSLQIRIMNETYGQIQNIVELYTTQTSFTLSTIHLPFTIEQYNG